VTFPPSQPRVSDVALPGVDTNSPLAEVGRRRVAVGRRFRRINILMLCDLFALSYRVMRCFDAAGAAVHVLGGPGAKGLRLSRYCRSYRHSEYGFTAPCRGMVEEINQTISRHAINLVIAGDHRSTRTLLAVGASLSAPAFPMPALEQFDLLNNKWAFTELCQRLGIRCPRSELVPDRGELWRRVDAGKITLPCVAKPLDLDGSRGVVVIKRPEDISVVETIAYHPILVQEYIEGDDIGASVYCDRGKVCAFIAHKLKRATYSTFQSADIQNTIANITRITKVSGIFNFDMIQSREGNIYWLECNPRFFYKMYLSMLAGVSFAAFGLPYPGSDLRAFVPTGTNVRTFKAIAAELPRPWRLTLRDWAFVRHVLADPIPFFREFLRSEL
jgi:predicted ATP-grasp superfamily ATP-dependent carboligase